MIGEDAAVDTSLIHSILKSLIGSEIMKRAFVIEIYDELSVALVRRVARVGSELT